MAYRKRSYRKKTDWNSWPVLVVLLIVGFVVSFSAKFREENLLLLVSLVAFCLIVGGSLFIFWLWKRDRERLRALQLSDVDSMDGVVFERYVAEVLKSQGYRIAMTKVTGDFGGDIVTDRDGVKMVWQLKRYTENVGLAGVQQAVPAMKYYSASASGVVTNRYFTDPAKTLAKVNGCRLVDRDELAEWIVGFQKKK